MRSGIEERWSGRDEGRALRFPREKAPIVTELRPGSLPADEDDDADEDPKHKFPEDEVLELIAAIKATAEEHGQENMGQHAQVWKRLSGVFNRTSDVLFFKWKALQFVPCFVGTPVGHVVLASWLTKVLDSNVCAIHSSKALW
ncbi:hypothetical protein QJQ45_016345 [Haematococcus lacustris]|nr:hypothetical protein QJQ45_016345 [Haematococcus lacustris]